MFERKVIFTPVSDRRNPDPSKDYGIQSVGVYFMLYGNKGVVEFQICSRWLTTELHAEIDPIAARQIVNNPSTARLYRVFPADVCRWSRARLGEDDTEMSGVQRVFNGDTCYYDYKMFGADELYRVLCNEGDECVWEYLESYYTEEFGQE